MQRRAMLVTFRPASVAVALVLLGCSGHVEADPPAPPRSALPAAAVNPEGVEIAPLEKPPLRAPTATSLPHNMKLPGPPPGP